MDDAKHERTELPWEWCTEFDDEGANVVMQLWSPSQDDAVLTAKQYPGENCIPNTADADFILTACNSHEDILAALRRLADLADDARAYVMERDVDLGHQLGGAIAAAEAAIAKATGKSA